MISSTSNVDIYYIYIHACSSTYIVVVYVVVVLRILEL